MPEINHLAVIMDGNRRWAKSKGLPTLEGHRRGYNKMKDVGQWCLDRGIKFLTVYAFSTENWNRSKKEVDYLMKLLEEGLTKELPFFQKKDIKLRIIGRRRELSKRLKSVIDKAERATAKNKRGVLNIAINYGGRLEIVEAIKKISQKKISPGRITEQMVSKNTWTAGQPDPDLVIRTSGEKRLSGFLTWQSVYSELYFCSCHWPAFTKKEFDRAIADFEKRRRRFGGN